MRTNQFPMHIDVPGAVIYHYDVEFTFSEKKQVKNKKLLLEAINRFKEKYPKISLNPCAVVFDGSKNVFTCRELNFSGKFEGEIEIKEHADVSKGLQIKVILKYTLCVDVNDAIAEYKFHNIKVNRKEFHKTKQPINLDLVNVDQIVVSEKLKHSDGGLKYFIDYEEGEIVKLLCII